MHPKNLRLRRLPERSDSLRSQMEHEVAGQSGDRIITCNSLGAIKFVNSNSTRGYPTQSKRQLRVQSVPGAKG
jgi:hypothetical protein